MNSKQSFPDSFLTIENSYQKSLKIRNSTFISFAFPITSKADTAYRISEIQKEHHTASHICFAYILEPDSKSFHYTDAGEPHGTAGIKIYNSIKVKNLTNVLVAVVRYFGGTKLGIGPLGKAYSQAGDEVLVKVKKIQKFLYSTFKFKLKYEEFNNISKILNEYSLEEINPIFTDNVKVVIKVRKSMRKEFENKMLDFFRGERTWSEIDD